jgi:serine/threonine-protein kinase
LSRERPPEEALAVLSDDGERGAAPPRPLGGTVMTTAPAAEHPSDAPSLPRGTAFDRYLILDRLGAGGMGVVYAAYDAELDRKLALKILSPGKTTPDGSEGRLRLMREAQAMARLSHENVIAVHDVGSVDDQVFVAMEYIDGTTLRQWLQARPRRWREVVARFVSAGRGLAAAHTAGIVHRDFKPDNVMVAKDGRVRVLDFGLAGAAQEATGVAPAPTRSEPLIGTPLYLSPEQWANQPADARSDQFSFCVALYEALYGVRPFEGDTAVEVASAVLHGTIRPPPPERRVPPWLEQIVRRGLKVAPEERFASMDELLAALSADPDAERQRRRRGALIVAGFVVLAGVAAVGVVKGARIRARRCRGMDSRLAGVWDGARQAAVRAAFLATGKPYAEATADAVQRTLDSYAANWVTARTDACEATYVRRDQSESLLDLRVACFDRRLMDLGALTDQLSQAPDADVLNKAAEATSNLPRLEGCADARALAAVVPLPDDSKAKAKVEELRRRLAEVIALLELGKYKNALPPAKQLAVASKALDYAPLQAEVLARQADLELRAGNAQSAESTYREALLLAAHGRDDMLVATIWSELISLIGAQLARYHDAELLSDYAESAIGRAGNEPLARAAWASSSSTVLSLHGKHTEALTFAEESLRLREQVLGAEDLHVATALENVGIVLMSLGRYVEAARAHKRVLAIREKALGRNHPQAATSLTNLANVYLNAGIYEEAVPLYERALGIEENAVGKSSSAVAPTLSDMAEALGKLGRYDEARQALNRALAIFQKVYPSGHPEIGHCFSTMGNVALDEGRYEEARQLLERGAAILEKAGDGRLADALTSLARAQLGLGHVADAQAVAERALEQRDARESRPDDLADTQFVLARALWGTRGSQKRACELAGQAQAEYARVAMGRRRELAEIEQWLGGKGMCQ